MTTIKQDDDDALRLSEGLGLEIMDLIEELNKYAGDWRTRAGDVSPVHKAIAEIKALRLLAQDAAIAWDEGKDSRVGKLLRAMVDVEFRKTYKPDIDA